MHGSVLCVRQPVGRKYYTSDPALTGADGFRPNVYVPFLRHANKP